MLLRRTAPSGVVFYASPLLEAAGIAHAFTTRIGGVSDPSGPFGTLNLGNPSDAPVRDSAGNIRENCRLALQAASINRDEAGSAELCTVHQVHGAGVVTLRAGQPHDPTIKSDAIVSDDPKPILSIRVADCAPVLLAMADGAAVAAVHAGWRGVAAGIVRAAAQALRALRPSPSRVDLVAAIGPCIGVDAFEVGPEVIEALHGAAGEGLFGDEPFVQVIRQPDPAARPHVGIREALCLQLRAEGLHADHIDLTDRCTFRDHAEFFSHRRDRALTGRMAAFISPRPAPG
jgi:hypothetical protein